ncbi:hypothetical protein H6P81_008129 [Aristolochia fimbriata]|uniref:F-box domain-containing protein n=1 Tax=Aristolochia fimbriata TaxID=158543 RepID=A0AAV7F255_ARIFI|nr:hypothetical protein H6P81_008129 [Aristolochia fimbriata]
MAAKSARERRMIAWGWNSITELEFNSGFRSYYHDDIIGEEGKWKELAPELLAKIFEKVGLEQRILDVPFVCKSWHKVLRSDPECWKSLNFQQLSHLRRRGRPKFAVRFSRTYLFDGFFSFSGVLKLLARVGGAAVEEIVFSKNDDITIDALAFAAEKCPGVKTLALPLLEGKHGRMGYDKRLPSVIGKWKDLESFSMVEKGNAFVKILQELGANCEKFAELSIQGAINHWEASAITDFLPKIKRLHFCDSYLLREPLVKLLDGCKELQVLDLKSVICFKADEEIQSKASRIKTFDVKRTRYLTEEESNDPWDDYDDIGLTVSSDDDGGCMQDMTDIL